MPTYDFYIPTSKWEFLESLASITKKPINYWKPLKLRQLRAVYIRERVKQNNPNKEVASV